mgnify:FL=1|jgi:peptidoglycan hydrolase-like protein with peptidoglycan-binding domain|tara:strand:- start:1073 stop:1519 length:447 start_codon:yes stop_codon:yes gene_type:complete
MNTKKLILITLGGVATAGVGYLVFSLLRKKPTSFGEAVTDVKETIVNLPDEVSSVVTSKYTDKGFPLRKGSGGDKVKALQKFLNDAGSYGLAVDGKFGNLTENAVLNEQMGFDGDDKSWQNFKNFYPDAVKGQVTEEYYNLFIKGKFD